MLHLEALLLRNALAGLRDVNLDVQILWAQGLVVHMSWQAQHFVDLEVKILWQDL